MTDRIAKTVVVIAAPYAVWVAVGGWAMPYRAQAVAASPSNPQAVSPLRASILIAEAR